MIEKDADKRWPRERSGLQSSVDKPDSQQKQDQEDRDKKTPNRSVHDLRVQFFQGLGNGNLFTKKKSYCMVLNNMALRRGELVPVRCQLAEQVATRACFKSEQAREKNRNWTREIRGASSEGA